MRIKAISMEPVWNWEARKQAELMDLEPLPETYVGRRVNIPITPEAHYETVVLRSAGGVLDAVRFFFDGENFYDLDCTTAALDHILKINYGEAINVTP